MKVIEKILRAPLPDQLKALLEKFDIEFDASHLIKLGKLADERSLTWYERRMLKRAHRKAVKEHNRAVTLEAAMSIVLNIKDRPLPSQFNEDLYTIKSPLTGSKVPVGVLLKLQQEQAQANNRASQYAQGFRMYP